MMAGTAISVRPSIAVFSSCHASSSRASRYVGTGAGRVTGNDGRSYGWRCVAHGAKGLHYYAWYSMTNASSQGDRRPYAPLFTCEISKRKCEDKPKQRRRMPAESV